MKSSVKKSASKKSFSRIKSAKPNGSLRIPAAPKGPSRFRKLRSGQLSLLEAGKSAYGGSLRNTRRGRMGARPLSTRSTMHLVLRSSKAKGLQSFLRPQNAKRVKSIVDKFSFIYGVQILSQANVGNHLHIHLRLTNRYGYSPFIKAITGAIAMAVSGRNRWTANQAEASAPQAAARDITGDITGDTGNGKFWDHRPFTRVIEGLRGILRIEDYVRINQLEALGFQRPAARRMIDTGKSGEQSPRPKRE